MGCSSSVLTKKVGPVPAPVTVPKRLTNRVLTPEGKVWEDSFVRPLEMMAKNVAEGKITQIHTFLVIDEVLKTFPDVSYTFCAQWAAELMLRLRSKRIQSHCHFKCGGSRDCCHEMVVNDSGEIEIRNETGCTIIELQYAKYFDGSYVCSCWHKYRDQDEFLNIIGIPSFVYTEVPIDPVPSAPAVARRLYTETPPKYDPKA